MSAPRIEAARDAFERVTMLIEDGGPSPENEDEVVNQAVIAFGNVLLSIAESLHALASKKP